MDGQDEQDEELPLAKRRLRRYHLAFTPKALNSKAQCREALTGCDWKK